MTAPSSTEPRTYAVEQRLRMIDFLLHEYGHVNRTALVEWFGISTAQASHDIGEYQHLSNFNATYDKGARRYVRAEGFRRVYP